MKKFAFTLERMLGFKRTMYEKERNTLAQLRAERLGIEQRRDAAEQMMLERDADFRRQAAEGGVRIDEVRENNFYRESTERLMDELEAQMAALDVEIEKQLQVVIELDKEVKSLEKLRETQWEEYVAAANKEENERILEIVASKFVEEQQAQVDEEQHQAVHIG